MAINNRLSLKFEIQSLRTFNEAITARAIINQTHQKKALQELMASLPVPAGQSFAIGVLKFGIQKRKAQHYTFVQLQAMENLHENHTILPTNRMNPPVSGRGQREEDCRLKCHEFIELYDWGMLKAILSISLSSAEVPLLGFQLVLSLPT